MDKVVYRHLKPNGEVFYIGVGDLNRPHSKKSRNSFWKNTVNKYGYEVQILKSNLTWEEATEIEIALISFYGRRDLGTGTLVNLTDGGDGTLNYTHSDEIKTKISEAGKGNTYRRGKKASKEAREKMSLAQMGNTNTKGRKHTEEAKAKISEAQRGRKHSEEAKANMSKAQSGKVISEEHRLKLSEALKGFKHSEETKLKMSEGRKGEKHPTAKKVINTETGVTYPTITEAAEKENINKGTLWYMLKGKNPNKTNLILI